MRNRKIEYIIRAKTNNISTKNGSVFGSLVTALAIYKALPMSYNQDLQEAAPNLWPGRTSPHD